MSDVYAMGGEVLYALNLGGFPGPMEPAIVTEIMRGGAEKVIEAGAVVAGGHTVTDDEPKYGLAVTGIVHPDRIFTKGGANPGDVLALTKPLGTGTISTALKRDLAAEAHVQPMVESMKRLNRAAAQAGQAVGVKGATDISGFGLLGHGTEMAQAAAGRKFVISFNQVPLLPGALEYAAQFIFPGGSFNNKLFFEKDVTFAPSLSEEQQMLLWDAQTSGGLLVAVPVDRLADFEAACAEREQPAWVIGEVTAGRGIEVLP
jgi:selenide,water dikinase